MGSKEVEELELEIKRAKEEIKKANKALDPTDNPNILPSGKEYWTQSRQYYTELLPELEEKLAKLKAEID